MRMCVQLPKYLRLTLYNILCSITKLEEWFKVIDSEKITNKRQYAYHVSNRKRSHNIAHFV